MNALAEHNFPAKSNIFLHPGRNRDTGNLRVDNGVEWSGVEWSGVEWSGVEWSGVE